MEWLMEHWGKILGILALLITEILPWIKNVKANSLLQLARNIVMSLIPKKKALPKK